MLRFSQIIVFIPFLSYVVYPTLARYNVKFGRITRITFGFTLAWISGIIGAIVQWKIYRTSPCGYYASTDCTIGTGVSPISVWVQIPNVALGAMSECFCNVTAYELAYARSPKGMKALVMSLFLATTALSYALGEIVTPAIVDPHLIWVWAAPAIALFVQTCIFWWRYRKFNVSSCAAESEIWLLLTCTQDDEFMTYDDQFEGVEHEKMWAGSDSDAKEVKVPETISEGEGEDEGPKGKKTQL